MDTIVQDCNCCEVEGDCIDGLCESCSDYNYKLQKENTQLREGGELLIDNSRPLNYEAIVYNQYCKGREIFKALK